MGVIVTPLHVTGRYCKLYALASEKRCPLLDFMAEQERRAPEDLAHFLRIVQYCADHGPPKNKEKCRSLGNDIWELKGKNGIRVLWFWDEGRIIVCTHGFVKKQRRTPRREIEKARKQRDAYFVAKSAGILEHRGG